MISTRTKLERQWFKTESEPEDERSKSCLIPQIKFAEVGLQIPDCAGISPIFISEGKFPILSHTWSPPKRSPWLDLLESHDGLVIGNDVTGALMLAGAFSNVSSLAELLRCCRGNGFVSGSRAKTLYAAAILASFYSEI